MTGNTTSFKFFNSKHFYKLIIISILMSFLFFWWTFYYSNPSFKIDRELLIKSTSSHYFRSDYDSRWTWTCINNTCSKLPHLEGKQTSLQTCNMMCFQPQLWPIPRVVLQHGKRRMPFHFSKLHLKINLNREDVMLDTAFRIFLGNIRKLVPEPKLFKNVSATGKFLVKITLEDFGLKKLKLNTQEAYSLMVRSFGENVVAHIKANNFFGARHGLETLSQLIWFDNVERKLNVLTEIIITDKPKFPHRGLMVDTARNYFPVKLLLKILDGLAANKLNVFHWHMTDSQSFPFLAPSFPHLAKYGSYNPNMVYQAEDIVFVVEYAKVRGIRVLIEVDVPSHVLSGWKEIEATSKLIFSDVANINGQFNPENPDNLKILRKLYGDILRLTENDDLFHIGGDEVNLDLWEDPVGDQENDDTLAYWASYMNRIISTVNKANAGRNIKNIIIWSSPLTESRKLGQFFDRNTTIIQYWYGNFYEISKLGFRVIFSNVEAWYLDCGFGAWQENRQPSCEPYKTWQTMYKAVPWRFLNTLQNALGGEACMWTEMIGADSLETKIWPRTAAFAERLWSDPYLEGNNISSHVYTRLDTQRERMSRRDIKSEVLWPKFCTLNPGKC